MKIQPLATALIFSIALPISSPSYGLDLQTQLSDDVTAQSTKGQSSYDGYVAELKKAGSSPDFTGKELDRILQEYSDLLMAAIDNNQLQNAIQERHPKRFPLQKLKDESFYQQTIQSLLKSTNANQRILAYATLSSAGDSSNNDVMLNVVKTEKIKNARVWAALALLYLGDSHTSDLFDYLVNHEELGDSRMVPLYMQLDKAAVKKTAYEKLKSNNRKTRILAVESLASAGPDPETDKLVKEAVASWDPSLQGYAVNTLKELGVGNLRTFVSPLLEDKTLRQVCLDALANSPTLEDQDYLAALVPTTGEVPKDVLDAYLQSTHPEAIRKWLTFLRERQIPPNYHFFSFDQPLLKSEGMIGDVKSTIRRTQNRQILRELPRALAGRKDEDSIGILVQLLSDKDPTVRYWAATWLKGCNAPSLVAQLPKLIRNQDLRVTSLTELAIENKVTGLQDVYETYAKNEPPTSDWYRSALQYLAAFPRPEDKELFRSILHSDKDALTKRLAAQGLGELHDAESVDLIQKALQAEPKHDLNALTYLIALGKIKGEKAKTIVESYKNSKYSAVSSLTTELLSTW